MDFEIYFVINCGYLNVIVSVFHIIIDILIVGISQLFVHIDRPPGPKSYWADSDT